MHRVVQMLEANIESLQMPPKPFLVPQQTSNDDRVNMANPTSLRDASNVCSIDSSYQYVVLQHVINTNCSFLFYLEADNHIW